MLTWIAFAFALATLGGSLWLSIGMNLKACPLCFYQRTFIMAIVAVMTIASVARLCSGSALSTLVLPLAFAALGVAGFHVSLELNGTLECPKGLFGIGTAPQQALAALLVLTLLLLIDALRIANAARSALVSAIIGGILGYAAVVSSPPLPNAPTEPHAAPLEVCRPPYVDADDPE